MSQTPQRPSASPRSGDLLYRRLGLMATVCALLIAALAARIAAEDRKEKENDWERGYGDFARVFAEVYRLIETEYYEERDPDVLFRAALDGMMGALDPHSQYLAPDSFTQLEKDTGAEFSGIGIHITKRDGVLTVIAPIPGGPSARLGVQPWDRIVEIEGKTTEGMSTTDAVKVLTGPVGTEVKIKVWRPGLREPVELSIVRERIRVHNVFHKNLGGGVGLIRIDKFADRVSDEVLQALREFRDEGVRGVIVDVRFNAGGLLDEAIKVSDLFLPPDAVIVSTRGRDNEIQQEYRARTAKFVDWPMMVLINEGSASASEIFAAAMQDHKIGVLVGPKGGKTFGKGSVQTVIPQHYTFERDEQDNALYGGYRLTTALYYTPAGVTIHNKGIKPDIEVELPEGQIRDLLAFGLIGGPDMRGPMTPEEEKAAAEGGKAASETSAASPADGEKGGDKPEADVIEMAPEGEPLEIPDPSELPVDAELEEAPEGANWDFTKPVTSMTNVGDPSTFVDVQLEEAVKTLKGYIELKEETEVKAA